MGCRRSRGAQPPAAARWGGGSRAVAAGSLASEHSGVPTSSLWGRLLLEEGRSRGAVGAHCRFLAVACL